MMMAIWFLRYTIDCCWLAPTATDCYCYCSYYYTCYCCCCFCLQWLPFAVANSRFDGEYDEDDTGDADHDD